MRLLSDQPLESCARRQNARQPNYQLRFSCGGEVARGGCCDSGSRAEVRSTVVRNGSDVVVG